MKNKKKILIITTIIIILLISISIIILQLIKPKQFSEEDLKKANTALIKGITIADELNDFVPMTGRKLNNSNPYDLPYLDLKSISMGADKDYLYVKYESAGNFPKGKVKYKGDTILSRIHKLNIRTVDNENNVSTEMIETADIVSFYLFDFIPNMGHRFVNIKNQEDYDKYENAKLETYNLGMLEGGSGYNYLIAAYPLKDMGISFGDEIEFQLMTETESKKFDHASVDVLLGEGLDKNPATIRYIIGSNQYEIIIKDNK